MKTQGKESEKRTELRASKGRLDTDPSEMDEAIPLHHMAGSS